MTMKIARERHEGRVGDFHCTDQIVLRTAEMNDSTNLPRGTGIPCRHRHRALKFYRRPRDDARQCRSGASWLIVWCRHQVEPDSGPAERYGARDDGAGLERVVALLALRQPQR
jgi:hypothetical protein